jgi:hypothetical protein
VPLQGIEDLGFWSDLEMDGAYILGFGFLGIRGKGGSVVFEFSESAVGSVVVVALDGVAGVGGVVPGGIDVGTGGIDDYGF